MNRWSWAVVFLVIAGIIAPSAYADDRLKITGYVDNHVHWIDNVTFTDDDFTRDDDERFIGRMRARLFFNIVAAENTKAVVALEFDQMWGEKATEDDGMDFGADQKGVTELKQLYVDFKVPGMPVRFQVGGPRFAASKLKDCVLLCADAAGINMFIDASPEARLILYYIQVQEEEDEDTGPLPRLRGEDYIIGTTLETKFAEGFDVNAFFLFAHESGPQFRTQTSQRIGSPGMQETNLFWFGVDARLRFGNLMFMPTIIYSGGKREFGPGVGDSDVKAFMVDVRGAYTMGAWKFTAKFVFTPGNEFTDDLVDDDIKFFQLLSGDGVQRSTQWFELLGFNIDTTTGGRFNGDSRGIDNNLTFDQFGLIHGAIKIDYQVMKQLTFFGALGFFATDEKVGLPARCAIIGCNATFNYTGDDRYLGTEIDVWLAYQIFPRATVNVYFAYAFIGDAYALVDTATNTVRDPKDIVGLGGRIIYRY